MENHSPQDIEVIYKKQPIEDILSNPLGTLCYGRPEREVLKYLIGIGQRDPDNRPKSVTKMDISKELGYSETYASKYNLFDGLFIPVGLATIERGAFIQPRPESPTFKAIIGAEKTLRSERDRIFTDELAFSDLLQRKTERDIVELILDDPTGSWDSMEDLANDVGRTRKSVANRLSKAKKYGLLNHEHSGPTSAIEVNTGGTALAALNLADELLKDQLAAYYDDQWSGHEARR